jgi:organic radical activating enzyme
MMNLPVMEHFYTLQGEGAFTGYAAYFIRLGGCDVGCTWCDVKESWDINAHPKMSIDAIADLTQNSGTKIAVITGGEPTMHDLTALTQAIQNLQIRTHIETSGTNPISGDWDWICFSPKRFKKPLEMYFELSHELKVVIAHKNDLRWAKEFEAKMHKNCKLYIQPEWDNRQEMTNLCIDFIKENPNWSLSLQTHKYIDIP